jgi:hypothetical protein
MISALSYFIKSDLEIVILYHGNTVMYNKSNQRPDLSTLRPCTVKVLPFGLCSTLGVL